jgi:hypothetical protein
MSSRVKPFGRRRFLRGLGGIAVGLPFLEALAPKTASGQAAAIKRFGVFFACNGVNMERWFPSIDNGALTDAHLMGTSNEVLIPHRSKLLFPRGVHMTPRGFGRDGGGADDHGKGMAHKLTAQFADDDDWLALGPSVDHVIAQAVNPGMAGSRRPALNLLVGTGGGSRGLGYISYSASGQAIQGINNPWNAYSDFMGLGGTGGTPSDAQMRIARQESVLDLVSDDFDDLTRGPLSSADRAKLDAHFQAIRELEMGMTGTGGVVCLDPALRTAAQAFEGTGDEVEEGVNYPLIADLQVDIMAMALACDATRVASLQFDRGAGGPTFRWDGMTHEYNHHKLSHGKVRDDCFDDSTDDGCDDVAGYEDMLYDIDVWHAKRLARLLAKLDSTMEADGKTVLDNSAILYTNELSDGRGHSFMNLPYILAGSCGGSFKQSEVVLLGEGNSSDDRVAPHNKLLNTLVNVMGIESDWFGVAEGSGGETMQGGVYDDLLV